MFRRIWARYRRGTRVLRNTSHLGIEHLEDRLLLAIFTVNSTDDVSDGVCDDTHCSLREAIEAANAMAGADTVHFQIAEPDVPTIAPTDELPTVTDPLTIDGTTQSAGRVEIDGTNAGGGSDGLVIVAGNSTVRGLVINRFPGRGIVLARIGGNQITGNLIGADVTGTVDRGNGAHGVLVLDTANNTIGGTSPDARNLISGNDANGVQIYGSGVRELATLDADALEQAGQVIDPDGDSVILLDQRNATITVPGTAHDLSAEIDLVNAPRVLQPVDGDFIAEVTVAGTVRPMGDSTHPERLPFNGAGILLWQDEANYVRLERAAYLQAGELVTYALFELREGGLFTVSQTLPLPEQPTFLRLTRRGDHFLAIVNQGDALWNMFESITKKFPSSLEVGVDAVNTASQPFNAEFLSFNLLHIPADATAGNLVQGNLIGTDISGTADLGNGFAGVFINGAVGTAIGGTTAEARNVISGNDSSGVAIQNGAARNLVQGNFIGLDVTGAVALGNTTYGTLIFQGGSSNVVGGAGPAARNVISANGLSGVAIVGAGSDRNVVAGNFIGTDATGLAPLGNANRGVDIFRGAQFNVVGIGSTHAMGEEARNIISANGWDGIGIIEAGTDGNVVAGNFIGTDVTGAARLGNGMHGISVFRGAEFNRIGTDGDGATDADERNIIAANQWSGVAISESDTNNNVIAGNYIGTDVTGTFGLGNGQRGVDIFRGAQSNRIGTDGDGRADDLERNVISSNTFEGVSIIEAGTDLNVVAGNYIGTDVTGTAALGNMLRGINIFRGAKFNRIGTNGDGVADDAERNVISGNLASGVGINEPGTDGNVVAGNYIGLDATGLTALGNGEHGVSIILGAKSNRIGTDGNGLADAAERNLISGNGWDGVLIDGDGTRDNVVAGNFIGTNVTGDARLGNTQRGVIIAGGAQANRVGTNGDGVADAAERNVVSANGWDGVAIADGGTTDNVVAGNFIGTDVTGSLALGNSEEGVVIFAAAQRNRIGTNGDGVGDAAERNVISGNILTGVTIEGVGSDDNTIAGNLIGTDATGTRPLGNSGGGVRLESSVGNTIGGTTADERNVISGNAGTGVSIAGPELDNWAVGWWRAEGDASDVSGRANDGLLRNGTGFSSTGIAGRAFLLDGVDDYVELGRGASLAGQAGFTVEAWVRTTDTEGIIVQQRQADEAGQSGFDGEYVLSVGNVLGAGGEGTVCWVTFGDSEFGFQFCSQRSINDALYHHIVAVREFDGTGKLYIDGVLDNSQASPPRTLNSSLRVAIGGDIRDNLHFLRGEIDEVAIYMRGLQSDEIQVLFRTGSGAWRGNLVQGNFIGTDVSGTAMLANSREGIKIDDIPNNTIGGTTPGAGNVISGGNVFGIDLFGNRTTGNLMLGNVIGADVTGTRALGNTFAGVSLLLAPGNTIGGTTAGSRNLISGNGTAGININSFATETLIQGNFIGTDVTGTADLGNGEQGVIVFSSNNTIGGEAAGARNVISGNEAEGVSLFSTASTANHVLGNLIGTDVSGTAALGNGSHGAAVDQRAGPNTIGGACGGTSNTIAFNGGDGVRVSDLMGAPTRISILCNRIFSNTGLGINLGADIVTANDPGDGDTGANNLQNFPVLSSAVSKSGVVTLRGSLNSTPRTTFKIEFFANDAIEPTGHGEGQRFLGSVLVQSNSRGKAKISARLMGQLNATQFVTATATDLTGNTSEFSPGFRVAQRGRAVQALVVARQTLNRAPVVGGVVAAAESFRLFTTILDTILERRENLTDHSMSLR